MKINSSPIVPLGFVHNYKQKWEMIEKINRAWRHGELDLLGFRGERGIALLLVPKDEGYSLNWFGGPGRERGDNPDFPGVSYHCDVKAVMWPRDDAPGLGPSDQAKPEWRCVQIKEEDLKRLHAGLPNLVGTGEPGSIDCPVEAVEPGSNLPAVRLSEGARPGIRTNKEEGAEAACRNYIAGLSERPRNKQEAFEAAKAAVGETGPLSENAFLRAWAGSAPDEWKKGGTRKGPRRK